MLKNGKSANYNENQNRKNRRFLEKKNGKPILKIAKTAKSKMPIPPLVLFLRKVNRRVL